MTPLARSIPPIKLRNSTLASLPAHVKIPNYRRDTLTPGIVHIGLGNFHRAHQAWFLHRLMQQGQAQDWGIIGAGIRPYDAAMRDKLMAQDYLTTLIELDSSRMSAEIIGPMIDYLPIDPANAPLIDTMSDPANRIVSLTVTEGGYYLDPNSGVFDLNHADIRHDAQHPDHPRTVFGAIVCALKRRRRAGIAPFTALSCDNLQGNGTILRNCVVGLAQLSDPDLATWIDQTASFPNSMVDCIVPATTEQVVAQSQNLGVEDQAPVSHENFRQWVIEDEFCNGRPAFEQVGVTLTRDVHSYEAMKLRILNGGHQVLANVGEVLGLETISDCVQDADVLAFFRKVQTREILPHVSAVPGNTPLDYLDLVQQRFANSAIRDTTRRVAFDGSARHPGFLLPSLRDAMAADAPLSGLALAEAFWARMCAGSREDGTAIAPNDPIWGNLNAAALAARYNPLAWIDKTGLYGQAGQDPRFREEFAIWLTRIWNSDSRAAIQAYLSN